MCTETVTKLLSKCEWKTFFKQRAPPACRCVLKSRRTAHFLLLQNSITVILCDLNKVRNKSKFFDNFYDLWSNKNIYSDTTNWTLLSPRFDLINIVWKESLSSFQDLLSIIMNYRRISWTKEKRWSSICSHSRL